MRTLPWRAALAFLALPGVIAFVVPAVIVGDRLSIRSFGPLGLILLLPGLSLLLWCVVAFYREGRGTLAPWDPPRALVVTGAYRQSRNPMYVAVALLLWAWALGFWSRDLAVYASIVMVAFHLRVVFGEEPWLARIHGAAWVNYKREVPRWIRLRWNRH